MPMRMLEDLMDSVVCGVTLSLLTVAWIGGTMPRTVSGSPIYKYITLSSTGHDNLEIHKDWEQTQTPTTSASVLLLFHSC